jgi:ribonuclease P protein component
VTRNRVRRRLRELVRARLPRLGSGAELVVRALPAAAHASYADLGTDLDRCLSRCLRRLPDGPPEGSPDGSPERARDRASERLRA